jgi:hypothetical protein
MPNKESGPENPVEFALEGGLLNSAFGKVFGVKALAESIS